CPAGVCEPTIHPPQNSPESVVNTAADFTTAFMASPAKRTRLSRVDHNPTTALTRTMIPAIQLKNDFTSMFVEINELRSRPLPLLESLRASRKTYRDLPIDQTTAFFSERLARASDFGIDGRNHYAHARNPPYYARAEGAIEALLVRENVGRLLEQI